MDPKTLVLKLLDEAHATETALVSNLTAHIAMTTDSAYKRLLQRHLQETREQVEAIDRRRAQLGEDGGRGPIAVASGLVRDAVGQALVLSKGPLDVVRTPDQQERMLKNAKDECATEALEIATYDALEAAAKAVGDDTTARLAADHRKEEERMLSDLRETITRLAGRTVESRTGTQVKAAPKRKPRAKAKAKPRAKAKAKPSAKAKAKPRARA
jgi:ferritin-like metal-binding protein YciE